MNPQPKPPKPWRSKKYREYVTTLPCCLTGYRTTEYLGVDPHHQPPKGGGGKSTKVGDDRCIPIRHDLHVRMESPGHSRASVFAEYGVDPERVIDRVRAEWVRRGGRVEW